MKEIREFCEFQHSRFSLVRFHDFFANFLSQKITLIFHCIFFSRIWANYSSRSFSRFLRFLGYFLTSEKIRELISLLNFVAIEFFSRFLANFSTLVFISFVRFCDFFPKFPQPKNNSHFSLHFFFTNFGELFIPFVFTIFCILAFIPFVFTIFCEPNLT